MKQKIELLNDNDAHAIQLVWENEGMIEEELIDFLSSDLNVPSGISKSTVNHLVKNCFAIRVIESSGAGRVKRIFSSDYVLLAIKSHESLLESQKDTLDELREEHFAAETIAGRM